MAPVVKNVTSGSAAMIAVALAGAISATPVWAQSSAWDFGGVTTKPVAARVASATETAAAPKASNSGAAAKETRRTTRKTAPAATPTRNDPANVSTAAATEAAPATTTAAVPATASSPTWQFDPVPAHAPVAAPPAVAPRPVLAAAAAAAVTPAIVAAAPESPAAKPAAEPVAAAAAAAPEKPKPAPTGLERMSEDWPKAVKVGVQYRGRVEGQRGSSVSNGRDDAYYLNRFRLETTVTMSPWLKGYAQVNDAQTLGYNVATQPTSMTDTLDLRQGYLDARGKNGLGLRVGRQEMTFGDGRLVGHGEWNNVGRSFDGARVSFAQPGVQVDAFVASVVVADQSGFDRRKPGETFAGAYASLKTLPRLTVEPYMYTRTQDTATSELGVAGSSALYTTGARLLGPLPQRLDYDMDVAVQRGQIANDDVAAWAGHYALGWTNATAAWRPRLVVGYNHASGDTNPTDGKRETFDQLFPNAHTKYGIADQIGWRNMQELMVTFEVRPSKKMKVNADGYRMFLATTQDGLYGAGGTRKVLNRAAASRSVGTELDIQTQYLFSKELSVSVGNAMFAAGDYLSETTHEGTLFAPYVMWTVKF